jgi:hypothetical protein
LSAFVRARGGVGASPTENNQGLVVLNMELCKKCIIARTFVGWDIADDHNWKAGYVECPTVAAEAKEGIVNITRRITKLPPKKCPYLFEQAIATGMAETGRAR